MDTRDSVGQSKAEMSRAGLTPSETHSTSVYLVCYTRMNHSALHFTITDPHSGNFKPAEVRNDADKLDLSPNSEQMSLFVNVTPPQVCITKSNLEFNLNHIYCCDCCQSQLNGHE